MQPTLEFRMESLELRTSKVEAGFIQLSNTSVTKQDIKQEIQQAYLYIGDTINTVIKEMNKQIEPITKRLDWIEQDISDLKATQTEQGAKLDQILELLKKS